ncbi:MAG: phenylacetate--CoA ligase [Actinomycetota bacterium]|jgi:phenylacetate-CoA ligase|nr:phenylacetate--CoA ligase [Actinomycetota bacterium]
MLQPEYEAMPRAELQALQDERLEALVRRVYQAVGFYRKQLDSAGVGADPIRGSKELARLPFTMKSDLRDNYPFGMLATDRDRLARVHASSGTTGTPVVAAYTRSDLDVFAEVMARGLAAAGGRAGSILHNAYGYGLFTGGLGFHAGAERLGMTVLPMSTGATDRQVKFIMDLRPVGLACTPSYALTLAQEIQRRGVAPDDISLEFALVGAEPWTETMRAEIERLLGARCLNVYGLSEIIGPGVAFECAEGRQGSHINEDHFLPEIVDPESGERLPEGSEGVLVITTLTKQALPLLRYWTGDVASLTSEPCACGRTFVRMSPVRGRTDDMLIVRGVNLYPTQIEEALGKVPELTPSFEIVLSRDGVLDVLTLHVEVSEDFYRMIGQRALSDEVIESHERLRELKARAIRVLRDSVGLHAEVVFLAPGEAPRSEGGKLSRVKDLREVR